MTIFLLLVISGIVYYFNIYKVDYTKQKLKDEKCPNCGNYVELDFNVCPICKETLKKKCLNCGEKTNVSWNYCPYCTLHLNQGEKE